MTDDLGTVTLVVGAVGRPGERVFFLQARTPAHLVTVKCEKQQVAALAEYLERLLADLPATDTPSSTDDLTPPLEPRFVLGSIGLAYDEVSDRFIVVLEEVVEQTEGEGEEPEVAEVAERDGVRLEMTRGAAAVFCQRARRLIAAGRPTCRWCGGPMDPDGHACPRMN
jgi:uncharacterized repeat protein (TIGR03847 family)